MTDEDNAPDPFADKPYDASDPEQINLARKKAGRRKKNRLEVIKAMMDIPEGRMWLYEFLLFTHVFSTPYQAGEPYNTAFRCGEQNVGQKVLSDIMEATTAEKYLQMTKDGKAMYGM